MDAKPKILLNNEIHKGDKVVTFRFPYDKELIYKVKKIKGIRWSRSMKCWYFMYDSNNNQYIISELNNHFIIGYAGSNTATYKTNKYSIDVKHNKTDNLLYIKIPYALKEDIKRLEGARWHAKSKLWITYATNENIRKINESFNNPQFEFTFRESNFTLIKQKKNPFKDLNELSKAHKKEIEEFKEWMIQKRYSDKTIKSYESCLTVFFRYFSEKTVPEITRKDIENFNLNFIIKNSYSSKTQNQYISAIKSFYLKMKGVNYEISYIERPVEGLKVPKVIPISDVSKMLAGIKNIKHKTALTTIYSLGLRRSELLNLKLKDISFKRDTVDILNSKGKKDRVLPLPEKLKKLITVYYREFKPKVWLIEGQTEGKPYSATSLENIFKKNLERVIKNHNFTLHSLRHSYATHLMDMGVDLRIIQKLLGHKSSKTTEIYTHVSMRNLKNVKNPLDGFEI